MAAFRTLSGRLDNRIRCACSAWRGHGDVFARIRVDGGGGWIARWRTLLNWRRREGWGVDGSTDDVVSSESGHVCSEAPNARRHARGTVAGHFKAGQHLLASGLGNCAASFCDFALAVVVAVSLESSYLHFSSSSHIALLRRPCHYWPCFSCHLAVRRGSTTGLRLTYVPSLPEAWSCLP